MGQFFTQQQIAHKHTCIEKKSIKIFKAILKNILDDNPFQWLPEKDICRTGQRVFKRIQATDSFSVKTLK